MKNRILLFVVIFFLTGCMQPTEEMIQNAIAATELANINNNQNNTLPTVSESLDGQSPALTPTEIINPTFTPNQEFGSRTNPFPLNEVFLGKAKDSWFFSLQITEVVRGDKATEMVLSANSFNDEPDEDFDYMLIKAKLIYLENTNPDEIFDINENDFGTVSNNLILDNARGVEPKPQFDCELFVGGTCEGWVILNVYKDDPAPLIFFENYPIDKAYFDIK